LTAISKLRIKNVDVFLQNNDASISYKPKSYSKYGEDTYRTKRLA
jgi:hypothetical protein